MIKTIYASELGKAVAKNGKYRAYKDGEVYAIYSVAPELIWDANYNFTVGKKLEAIHRGYVAHIENFEMACVELDIETAYLMKEGA